MFYLPRELKTGDIFSRFEANEVFMKIKMKMREQKYKIIPIQSVQSKPNKDTFIIMGLG